MTGEKRTKPPVENFHLTPVSLYNFHLVEPGAALQAIFIPNQDSHMVTGIEKSRHQTPPDITRYAGYQYEPILHSASFGLFKI